MLRIFVQSTIPDARAKVKEKAFQALGLQHKLGAIRLVECYTIDADVNQKQTQKAKTLLANPLIESAETVLTAPRDFNYVVEIGYLPGVTDNVGSTAKESLADGAGIKFEDGEGVYSSQIFFISFDSPTTPSASGDHPSLKRRGSSAVVPEADIQRIANSLYNPLIQRATIVPLTPLSPINPLSVTIPKVKLSASNTVNKIDLNIGDEELANLGKLGIKNNDGTRRGPLSLSLDYLQTIRNHFNKPRRKPTDVEIETLGQTWSEHCKHTIFADPMDELDRGIYKTYIKGATEKIRKEKGKEDFCVSVFTDNAGGIIFDDNYIITHKVETHNTPSALGPFGGAITGIVGVNRDCLGFGLGAKPVINTYGFCFGLPEVESILYRDQKLQQPMLSNKRIMSGVIAGINSGGNQSGIPTNSGFMYFHDNYRGKPLVFAGTVGLIPRMIDGQPSHIKQQKSGDLIVMVGGRVGADGIHGATFASETLDTHSPATAVQIGDPITQKKFSDALIEARDLSLYSSITDCGAGGLSSAVGEMAQATNGCLVNLEKVPLKYPGLAPWQTWISESQERMVLAVRPDKKEQLFTLLKNRGVEATVIGKFTDDGKCVVKFGQEDVLNLDLEFLHNGRPVKKQTTQTPKSAALEAKILAEVAPAKQQHFADASKITSYQISLVLSSLNIAGQDFLSTQYDHEVQGGSVLKPLQGRGKVSSEATVTRPVLDSQKGVVLSYGLHPSYSDISPYKMVACAIDSAVRAAVSVGANVDYLALLDNFCWCSPEEPERLWQLKEAARACFDVATTYGTPFISGKDSMYNDFKGFDSDGNEIKISIPPTLLISAIGVIPDVEKTVSLDAKMAADLIYILGSTDINMGSSSYEEIFSPSPTQVGRPQAVGLVPTVNAEKNYNLYQTLFTATQENLLASSISVSRGGLIVALIKKIIGGGFGAEIDLSNLPGNWTEYYQAFFSETPGRILVSVAPENTGKFEKLMAGQTLARLGKITDKETITITNNNNEVITLKTEAMLNAYKKTFKDY